MLPKRPWKGRHSEVIVVKLPKAMLNVTKDRVVREIEGSDYVYVETIRYKGANILFEQMEQGYREMSQLNLEISEACQHV